MNKALLLTGIVLILLILGLFAVSAIVIYSSNDNRVVYIKPSLNYENDNTEMEKPVLITTSEPVKNTLCYQGVDQDKECNPYQEVPQDRTPCYKAVTLSCGKQVTVSCDYSVDQIKSCGHLDVPEQTKGYCYKTITLPCGQTKQVEVSCLDVPEQTKGYLCYPEVSQQKVDCYNKAEKGCS